MKSKEGSFNFSIELNKNEKALGRAYVPNQPLEDIYDPNTALLKGTAFGALDMPYAPKQKAGFN